MCYICSFNLLSTKYLTSPASSNSLITADSGQGELTEGKEDTWSGKFFPLQQDHGLRPHRKTEPPSAALGHQFLSFLSMSEDLGIPILVNFGIVETNKIFIASLFRSCHRRYLCMLEYI